MIGLAWYAALAVFLVAATAFAQSTHGLLQSEGIIVNTGRLRIHGDATIAQPSIGGHVEYIGDDGADTQRVASVSYESLYVAGASRKIVDDTAQALTVEAMLATSVEAQIIMQTPQPIRARGGVQHNGRMSSDVGDATLRLDGDRPQRLSGVGVVPVLETANRSTIQLLDQAMLSITRRLDLQDGIVEARSAGWLMLADSAWLWRSDAGSITSPPIPAGVMNLRYYGTRLVRTGAEMPTGGDVVASLLQENLGGITLSHDLTVHGDLVLGGHIHTEPDITQRYVLTFNSAKDVACASPWAEVDGTLIRTNVDIGRALQMNAIDTYVRFNDVADRGSIAAISLRTKRLTMPPQAAGSVDKVRRYYQLTMLDQDGRPVADSTFRADVGYAWRVQPTAPVETDTVIEVRDGLRSMLDSLMLLRYDGSDYVDHGVSDLPTNGDPMRPQWRRGISRGVVANGDFAIGLSSTTPSVVLDVRAFLEGALVTRAADAEPRMRTTLRTNDVIPTTSPSGYPFDLWSGGGVSAHLPLADSIVDWIVVELRSEVTGGRRYYYPGLLSANGHVVDPQTTFRVTARQVRTGRYYMALHHRNHLSVMTAEPLIVRPGEGEITADLSRGESVFGGPASLVFAGVQDGQRRWAMPAGDVDISNLIGRDDIIWPVPLNDEGYLPLDVSLDGILGTNDLNLIWNNRGRAGAVP
ncbi:MAG: hypothetical protein FGM24_02600 [Candidatus Kapabacteria bacterium]|nr:hypothetical protein [Candidatus Kapabacteria bacterium]